MGLAHAVVTAVARDDLADGGASGFVDDDRRGPPRVVRVSPVEVLIPDCKGDAAALDAIFAARPDVLNHNSRPSPACSGPCGPRPATPAASRVLARAKAAGLVTKSGLIVGMGETDDEVVGDARRPAARSASTSSRSASTCARRPTTCPSPAGCAPEAFDASRRER